MTEDRELAALSEILKIHLARYPYTEIVDCVKLIFQNEFAGAHIIANAQNSLQMLRSEWEITARKPGAALCEDIGNGLCRLHLAAAKGEGLSPERINDAFVATANAQRGSVRSFEKKLSCLRGIAKAHAAPFDWNTLDRFLKAYKAEGYPAVSHSGAYRTCYAPHYRVVERGLIASLRREWAKPGDRINRPSL